MTARWITADVFDGLATLEDGSVDLIVTSPPFLALRSYLPADHPDKHKEIGSEATPAEFIDVLLRVTAELRRVLAPHGSICVELGDTYAGGGGENNLYTSGYSGGQHGLNTKTPDGQGIKRDLSSGWPLSKSRTLIPQLFEIALAYGINPLTGSSSPAGQWRIRNVVTWARPNPPVGALGDKWRPATSDLIVACVSPKRYWDDLATRRPFGENTHPGYSLDTTGARARAEQGGRPRIGPQINTHSGAPLLDYWEIPLLEGEEPRKMEPKRGYDPEERRKRAVQQTTNHGGNKESRNDHGEAFYNAGNEHGAPLLDYWEIPPGGYKGSHYAVFPEELVVPCVKAMAPEKVCRTCGEPSRRIVSEATYVPSASYRGGHTNLTESARVAPGVNQFVDENGAGKASLVRQTDTLGWTDCGHGDDWRPGLVLDPFAGSGTTLSVATGHGHDAIGIDLDPRNADLARNRIGPFLFEETRMQ